MMGLGYLGNGGVSSSSPSNLSPLAPPFTVDRSNMKSNSNPHTNFTETPAYGVPFSSSLHSWQYHQPSASKPDIFTNCDTEVDALHTTSVPSANEYCYLGSEPINPPSTHWATPNPNTANLTDNPFSYPAGPKQYYPSYASQVVDNNASIVGLDEVNYELLSSSGLVPVVGSSHGDYSQGLSSLEFPPPWGGFWNGLPDGKHCKRTDADGSFDLRETDFPGPHSYRDYLKQVALPVERLMCEETHNITQRKCGDVLGREKNAGYLPKEQFDDKMGQNLGVGHSESSHAPTFGTSTMLTESRLQSSCLEPLTFSSNLQMSCSQYEKSFQLFDPCNNDCTATTSLMPVVRQPTFGTKMPASYTIASKSNGIRDVAAVKKKDVSSYNQSIEKEPLLPPSSEGKEIFLDGNHLSFHIGRNDQRVCASASSKEMLTKPLTRNALDNPTKVRGAQVPDINVSHGFSWSVDSTEAFKHTASSTEVSDHHNQGEDSPCWKGAPSSNVSPFETSEIMPPQNLMKKSEASSNLNFQGAQMFPPYSASVIDACEACVPNLQKESLSTDYSTSVPPKKNLISFPVKEQLSADDARSRSDNVLLIRSDRDQYLNNAGNLVKEYDLHNVLKSDSGSIQSQTKQPYPQELKSTSTSKVQLQAGAVNEGISTSDTSEDGCIPLHAVENVLCSPPSEEEAGKPHAVGLVPKINIQTLASTLHNLSELLLLYSSDDEWALKEQDSRTLERAISNISVCLSTKIVQSTPALESLFPKAGISHILEEGAAKVGPQSTNEVNIATLGRLTSNSISEQKRKCGVFDNNLDLDVASLRTDADTRRHHNVVQNIKKVLDENFPLEGDISSETQLYKNLWLDAEAELCFTGINSRFDRVKIQLENCKSDETKEKSMVVEKVPSSIVSPDSDLDAAGRLTPEANDIPKQKAPSIRYSSIASPGSHVNDVEASVMARLQILKCRGDNSSNVEENPWPNVGQPDFTDSGVPWQIVGSQSGKKSFDVVVGSRVQRHSDNSNEKNSGSSVDDCPREATEEFSIYLSEDPNTVQPCGSIRLHNQVSSSSGWYENSSSDWEHVLKDDFAWQK